VAFGAAGPAGALTGRGHLVALGVEDGRDVARLRSTFRLPVRTTRPGARGKVTLDGLQSTEQSTTRDLADGAVRRASSVTVGRYDLAVAPPTGTGAVPVTGSLTVTVRTETDRVG
jgi:hypothetical protein